MSTTSTENPSARPLGRTVSALEADVAVAEEEVTRLERAVLDATTAEDAQAARDALTRAELHLLDLLDLQGECGSCEGWPRGK